MAISLIWLRMRIRWVILAMGRSPGTVLPPPVRELLRHLLECRPDPVAVGGVRTGPPAPTGRWLASCTDRPAGPPADRASGPGATACTSRRSVAAPTSHPGPAGLAGSGRDLAVHRWAPSVLEQRGAQGLTTDDAPACELVLEVAGLDWQQCAVPWPRTAISAVWARMS